MKTTLIISLLAISSLIIFSCTKEDPGPEPTQFGPGYKITKITIDGEVFNYEYRNGLPVSMLRPDGMREKFFYNTAGKMMERILYFDNGAVAQKYNFTYNADGTLAKDVLSQSSGSGTTLNQVYFYYYSYIGGKLARMVSANTADTLNKVVRNYTVQNDIVVAMTESNPLAPANNYLYYPDLNKNNNLTDDFNGLFYYIPAHLPEAADMLFSKNIINRFEAVTIGHTITYTYTYDARGRVTKQTSLQDANLQRVFEFTYED